jgi:hypothetical protein
MAPANQAWGSECKHQYHKKNWMNTYITPFGTLKIYVYEDRVRRSEEEHKPGIHIHWVSCMTSKFFFCFVYGSQVVLEKQRQEDHEFKNNRITYWIPTLNIHVHEAENITQWYSACLPCQRPWVPFQDQKIHMHPYCMV